MQRDEWVAMGICYWETQSGLGYLERLLWSTDVEPEIQRMCKGSDGSIPSEDMVLGASKVRRALHSCAQITENELHGWGRWSDTNEPDQPDSCKPCLGCGSLFR